MRIDNTTPQPAPRAAVALTGRVGSARGPLPEVALTMTDRAGAQVARTHSGPDGQFRLPDVGAGTYILIASRDGYRPHAETTVLDAATAGPIEVTLAAAHSLHGTVHERGSGRPVAAAAVSAIGQAGDVLASTVSDPDGRYRINGVEATSLTLVVAAAAADPVAMVVQTDSSGSTAEQAVDVAVDTYRELSGRITMGATAVAGLPLTLHDSEGHPVAAAITDRTGGYRFERVKAGDYTVRSGTSAAQVTAVSSKATNVDVTLHSPY